MASQQSKDKHWLTQSCKDADLELDDHMYNEIVGGEVHYASSSHISCGLRMLY